MAHEIERVLFFVSVLLCVHHGMPSMSIGVGARYERTGVFLL